MVYKSMIVLYNCLFRNLSDPVYNSWNIDIYFKRH